MATFNINDLKSKVSSAESSKVNEGFKPLPSSIVGSLITEFGIYENRFGNNSVFIEVTIPVQDSDDRVLNIDRGLTLKDGSDNAGTLSLIKEVFAATGVNVDDATSGTSTIKSFGKEYELTAFKECYNKKVSAFVRETFEEGAKYDKGNIIENIYNTEGKNSAGEDQAEAFKKKIAEKPILIKTPRTKTSTTASGTAAAPASGSSAAGRL